MVATATNDTPFRVETNPNVILTSLNIHCYNNPCYYGNAYVLQGKIEANGVVWFDNPNGIRISDFLFQNVVAGSNTTIVIVGVKKV